MHAFCQLSYIFTYNNLTWLQLLRKWQQKSFSTRCKYCQFLYSLQQAFWKRNPVPFGHWLNEIQGYQAHRHWLQVLWTTERVPSIVWPWFALVNACFKHACIHTPVLFTVYEILSLICTAKVTSKAASEVIFSLAGTVLHKTIIILAKRGSPLGSHS